MKIIISPAKKMNVDSDTLAAEGLPVFIRDTETILQWMQQLSYAEAKKLWCCNDKIAAQNFERFQKMDLYRNLTPAILSYEGIQYQYMAPAVFEADMLKYVQSHLRILSGFYGVLKPMDGVTPYRLEMQAKACINGKTDLYRFWGRRLYEEVIYEKMIDGQVMDAEVMDGQVMDAEVMDGQVMDTEVMDADRTIINLASKEYSKCIESYLQPEDTYITCVFGEMAEGRVVQKGTYAKMARGEMVRFMAENKIENACEMQKFDRLDYRFDKALSTDTVYVFIRQQS